MVSVEDLPSKPNPSVLDRVRGSIRNILPHLAMVSVSVIVDKDVNV